MCYYCCSSCEGPATITSLLSGSDVGLGIRLLAGCTTGAMAVVLAQPTDVVKVRFQAQARSSGVARRYCSTIDAYRTIAKEEGIRGLWKGRLTNDSCEDPEGYSPIYYNKCAYFTLSCRNSSKHFTECDGQLHRTGDVRLHQGYTSKVHAPDR